MMLFRSKKRLKKDAADMASLTLRKSRGSDVWGRLLRNRLGMVGAIIVVIIVLLVVFAQFVTWHDYADQNMSNRFQFPNREHIMGTDNFGRDIWSRLVYGGRISLLVALMAVAISGVVGAILGSVSGYTGGATDIVITRILDIIMSIPALLLAIAISASLGSGPAKTALAISISSIPHGARIIRSTVMSVKGSDFVEAAKATGSRSARIIFKHIIPNTIAPLIVNVTLGIGGSIMAISGLSFIGLGVQPPIPEWGSILAAGRPYIRDFWPIILFPSLFITLTLLGFNLFGDALRDALDPRLKD